jgi:hypothetical protein
MKKLVLLCLLLAIAAGGAVAQLKTYPFRSIRDLQYVPPESLAVADTLTGFGANSNQARWTLQAPQKLGDTVQTVGIVVVPPGLITYTAGVWTMLLADTSSTATQWAGILIRIGALADSTQLKQNGFLNVNVGDVITMTGIGSEFPTLRSFSSGQFSPLAAYPITIIGSAPVPKPIVKNIGDFYTGLFPAGKIKYATGEPYEGMYVEFRNVTVNNLVNVPRGTFSFVDGSGNELSDYDWSHYFTNGHGSSSLPLYPADTNWAKIYLSMGVGVGIDTIRGIITTSSGSEGPRGYRIAPIFPGDVVISKVPAPPLVSSHRRNPVVVTPNDSAVISVKVTRQVNGAFPKTVSLVTSINNTAFTSAPMTFQASDTTWIGLIPKQAANIPVRYYIEVVDSFFHSVRLANSATNSYAGDTSKGYFLYTSLARALKIQDIQTTPYLNGRSPYLGAVVTLGGIITADTAHIALSPVTAGSTNAWYMQSTNATWSGLWLTTSDPTAQTAMSALKNGDSVLVTGTVQEQFDVTRLGNITAVVKVSGGNPEPAAVTRTTGSLNVGNGVAGAEAYEGMLVKLKNAKVVDVNPTFSDVTEYSVNDGSGPVVVQRSGKYTYSNIPADSAAFGSTILRVGNKIDSLIGIVYYSFNQYKFVPRTNADFMHVVFTGVEETGNGKIPAAYALSQNYPNPFNPSTLIEYALPASGRVTLKVYNVIGQEVRTLVDGLQDAGSYRVRFDATSLSTGVYFYRLEAGSFTRVQKMLLVK